MYVTYTYVEFISNEIVVTLLSFCRMHWMESINTTHLHSSVYGSAFSFTCAIPLIQTISYIPSLIEANPSFLLSLSHFSYCTVCNNIAISHECISVRIPQILHEKHTFNCIAALDLIPNNKNNITQKIRSSIESLVYSFFFHMQSTMCTFIYYQN